MQRVPFYNGSDLTNSPRNRVRISLKQAIDGYSDKMIHRLGQKSTFLMFIAR
jgi:hypothetical protein